MVFCPIISAAVGRQMILRGFVDGPVELKLYACPYCSTVYVFFCKLNTYLLRYLCYLFVPDINKNIYIVLGE